MGFLSREIVRKAAPLVAVGIAGAASAVLAQRRLAERRRPILMSGPPPGTAAPGPMPAPSSPDPTPPSPDPTPPSPGPPAPPTPTPEPPTPRPDPIPAPTPPEPQPVPPTPTPTPQPGVAVVGESQGPEGAGDVVVESAADDELDLERAVRSALLDVAPDGAGAVEVEVVGAMVVLRGRVDSPETIRALERAAAGTRGVEGVRVLLHLPGRVRRRS
jgi:outer membrane biosynthesis protein TonB